MPPGTKPIPPCVGKKLLENPGTPRIKVHCPSGKIDNAHAGRCSQDQNLSPLGQAEPADTSLNPKGGMLSPCCLAQTGTDKPEPVTTRGLFCFHGKASHHKGSQMASREATQAHSNLGHLKQLIQATNKSLAEDTCRLKGSQYQFRV